MANITSIKGMFKKSLTLECLESTHLTGHTGYVPLGILTYSPFKRSRNLRQNLTSFLPFTDHPHNFVIFKYFTNDHACVKEITINKST